jgi:large subunit ribosomal protein L18
MLNARSLRQRRKFRQRAAIRKKGGDRPRLSVFRSNKHIYAQVIDDRQGRTMAFASSLDPELRDQLKSRNDRAAAEAVGKLVAQRASKAGVDRVVFDRSGFAYHGRVAALADAAREGGLSF